MRYTTRNAKKYYENIKTKDYERCVCAICGIHDNDVTTCHHKLTVDHNHRNMVIRGLLCNTCNQYVKILEGYFRNNTRIPDKNTKVWYEKYELTILQYLLRAY